MNDYQKEQLDALQMVRKGLSKLDQKARSALFESIQPYLLFRETVDNFLYQHFNLICTCTCYESRTSGCCSKDGIITFFADTVVNALGATSEQLDRLEYRLSAVNTGHRCVYLTNEGCMWTVRPVVCAMFLCDQAMENVFAEAPEAKQAWKRLRQEEKMFKWPDRPVLFDDLEKVFLTLGYRSTLMHLNFSPGLLHVKRKAGLLSNPGK